MNVSKVSVSRNGWRTAGRAVDVLPGGVPIERVAGGFEIDVFGQDDRQASLGTGTGAAGTLAMDHRESGSPNSAAGKPASRAGGN